MAEFVLESKEMCYTAVSTMVSRIIAAAFVRGERIAIEVYYVYRGRVGANSTEPLSKGEFIHAYS